ncbi:uncharacterized protein EKO05_0002346 [Ascochyta rabiei]|uniref:Uncharacterized protein n=1 Tax=Didymella rabiei TaxID=5454 RepID=A0A162VMV8_DIDRA|nr:uncharacterized protein EKO05_0002346 [Ascochyta rabiei]KZM18540.1 hypothetical protein ST47_g10316 [Ascochyta rabiei]UPX11756.1 hypothetical protein EKO05_0002346 [Ascochyta rabiei]
MALQVPTVTVDDLRDFHAKHFLHALATEHVLHGVQAEPAEEYCEEEEGGLGYYEDGTPCTLTDEQIAMFRHSEIQAIIRKRRQQRDNGDGSEEGEAEDSVAEASTKGNSPASQSHLAMVPEPGKVVSGRVDKLKTQQWTVSSPRTKAKNKRNRDKYKAKKRDERHKREQARKKNHDEDEESDEWDAWHQAKGPDVQKDDTVDLDY